MNFKKIIMMGLIAGAAGCGHSSDSYVDILDAAEQSKGIYEVEVEYWIDGHFQREEDRDLSIIIQTDNHEKLFMYKKNKIKYGIEKVTFSAIRIVNEQNEEIKPEQIEVRAYLGTNLETVVEKPLSTLLK